MSSGHCVCNTGYSGKDCNTCEAGVSGCVAASDLFVTS
jgi:hypothetical protein